MAAAQDRQDGQTLGLALATVPLVWLLLGWRPSLAVSGHDGLANLLVLFRELSLVRGDWDALLYRPELLGGTKLRDAVGPWPVAALLAWLGLSPTAILNVATFLVQATIGFLGVGTAADLSRTWGAPREAIAPMRVAGIVACAFAPVLGWRVGHGHLTLLAGTLPYLAVLSLLAALGAGTLGVVRLAVCAVAVATGVLFTGHQMVLYGAVFGAPILLGVWASQGRRGRDLAVVAAILLGAFLVALPEFYGVWRHAMDTDSLRSLQGMSLTYGFLTAHPRDWLGSLLWTREAIAPWRHVEHHHEVNNPFGPMLLLAIGLVPWRRARPLALGALVSLLMALVFSMNVRPLSDLLLLLPPLGSFRVPTRAVVPVLYVLPVLALAGAFTLEPARRRWLAAAAAAGLAIALVPAPAREVAGWMAAAACLLPRARLPRAVAFVALALGGLGAFRERLAPFVPGDALLARAAAIGRAAVDQEPALVSPLFRVHPTFEWPELLANTAVATGLGSLDGYYFPQRRFVELVTTLRWLPYNPNALLLRFPPDHVSSRLLFRLYNVGWTVDESGRVRREGPTAGPAWFSAGIARTWRYQDLREELRRPADGLHNEARRRLWLMADDLHVWRAHLPEALDRACAQATVLQVDARRDDPTITARVKTAAPCPLTFATNYADNLRASALVGGASVPANVFPAYGALAAVWVPAGATDVRLGPVPAQIRLPLLWRALGLVLIALTGARVARYN